MNDRLVVKNLLIELFDSQLNAARKLHFSERNVRYWCQSGAPLHVMSALRRLQAGEISLRWARQLMQRRRRRDNGRRRA